MSDALSDAVLVQRAARGDNIAFSELVTRHYRRAVRVAYGMMKDRDDAEDMAQEAFTRVHRRLADFEGGAAFYTWLYRIVVNLCIDTQRKRSKERRLDSEEEADRNFHNQTQRLWPGSQHGDPAQHTERRELADRLARALETLPEIHQAVILLRELEGLSYDEIAKTLGIKKGTVMSRLFHARRAMQRSLGSIAGDENMAPAGNTGA